MNLYIFLPHRDWHFCGGMLLVFAPSRDWARTEVRKYNEEQRKLLSGHADHIIHTDPPLDDKWEKRSDWTFNWVLSRVVCAPGEKPGVMMNYNWG
jgi:hypothetical protein